MVEKAREIMNYLKKMALALALVAGLCGGAWAQEWSHRGTEQARASHQATSHQATNNVHQWGRAPEVYRNHDVARNHDIYRNNDAWYRNNPNYQWRNGQWAYVPRGTWGGYYPNGGYYPGGTWGYNPAGNWGYGPNAGAYGYGGGNTYQLGYSQGMRTGQWDRQSGRPYQPGNYQAYKNGGSVSGSNNKQIYRSGFAAGYRAGYGGGFGRGRGF